MMSVESDGTTSFARSSTMSISVFTSSLPFTVQSRPSSSSIRVLNSSNLAFSARGFSRYWASATLKPLNPRCLLNSSQRALVKVVFSDTLSPILSPMLNRMLSTVAVLSHWIMSRISEISTRELLDGCVSGSNSSTASNRRSWARSPNSLDMQKFRYFRKWDLPEP